MAILTEGYHAGEALLSESAGTQSREVVTLHGAAFRAGQVLGVISRGAASAAAVAAAGNAGNGSLGTITAGATAQAGAHHVVCSVAVEDGGSFQVYNPSGLFLGTAKVGTAFTGGGLTFTATAGTADYAVGDAFTVTVTVAAATHAGKYVAHDPAATDGSQVAAGVLYAPVDASEADADGVAIVRLAEVFGDILLWKPGIYAGDKAAGIAALEAAGVLVR